VSSLVVGVVAAGFLVVSPTASQAEPAPIRVPIAAYSLVTSTSESASGLIARVVLPAAGSCPRLSATVTSGSSTAKVGRAMQRRSTGPTTQSAFSALLVCEARIPKGAVSVSVAGLSIPAVIQRDIDEIAIYGDSGCRIRKGTAQDCNNPKTWPLPRVARSIARERADLVVFLGDFHYREEECPEASSDLCGGSPAPLLGAPFTDSAWSWVADTLIPMAPILRSAPLVTVRGNHELCERGGNGYFLMFHPAFGNGAACAPSSEGVAPVVYEPTWSTDLSIAGGRSLRLINVDSANGNDIAINDSIAALQRPLFEDARQMARGAQESWLLTHRPIAGLVSTELLPVPPGTATPWSSVTNTYASSGLLDRFDLMLSSHIHLAQAVTVPTLPPQVVLGNAGADPEPETGYAIPAYGPLTNGEGQPLVPGVEIPTATSLHTWVEFGYAMAKPTTSGWRLEMKDAGGRLFASCTAQERDLACN